MMAQIDKTHSERKCVADIFYVCGCFLRHFNFFNERAAASEKIFNDCF